MDQNSTDYLRQTISELDAEELAFVSRQVTEWRGGLLHIRPNLATLCDAALARLEHDPVKTSGPAGVANNYVDENFARAIKDLTQGELAFIAESATEWRDGLCESRERIAAVCNALCALLADDAIVRPARTRAEEDELRRLFDGAPVDDSEDSEIECGWTADRPKQEG